MCHDAEYLFIFKPRWKIPAYATESDRKNKSYNFICHTHIILCPSHNARRPFSWPLGQFQIARNTCSSCLDGSTATAPCLFADRARARTRPTPARRAANRKPSGWPNTAPRRPTPTPVVARTPPHYERRRRSSGNAAANDHREQPNGKRPPAAYTTPIRYNAVGRFYEKKYYTILFDQLQQRLVRFVLHLFVLVVRIFDLPQARARLVLLDQFQNEFPFHGHGHLDQRPECGRRRERMTFFYAASMCANRDGTM